MRLKLARASIPLLMLLVVAAQAAPAQAGLFRGSFHQTNLVSNIAGLAAITDPNLKNPWGLSSSSTSPIWVSDNNAGVSTLYTGAGAKVGLTVNIPAPGNVPGGTPTGTVFNGTSDFSVSQGGKTGVSRFLFATEDGTVLGWSPSVNPTNAVIMVDRSQDVDKTGDTGAVYKGLTSGSVGTTNYLFASNFRFGTVDVFDKNFALQSWAGAFTDSSLPSGYAPFGIQNIGGFIYVTYAKQDVLKHDDEKGAGRGFVDIYTPSGALIHRFASGGTLNSPWGVALAPSTFGNFHDAVLIGNFGDGLINAFSGDGRFRGQLKRETNAPIQNDGLWGLRFGNGGNGGDVNTLFFSAGINDEQDGLFGTIQAVSD